MTRKWIDNRLSEYLSIQGIDLSVEQYNQAVDLIELWLYENIDKVIQDIIQEVL
jgi:hypothetical protein